MLSGARVCPKCARPGASPLAEALRISGERGELRRREVVARFCVSHEVARRASSASWCTAVSCA